jgi:polar amino acid transport system substrate-binding protein
MTVKNGDAKSRVRTATGRRRRQTLAIAAALAILTLTVLLPAHAQQPMGLPPAESGQQASDMPRRVILRFLTEGDYPPFNFLDEDGALTGFNVDLARALCLELQTSCDIKVRPWGELFLALSRGEADAVIAGHQVTAGALSEVEFTERYFHTPARFAAKKDTAAAQISPEALYGARIGVAKDTAHEAFLRTFFRDSTMQTFASADLARDALVAGTIDYVFDDGVSLAFWLNGTLSKQCCEFRGGPYFEPKFFGDGIAIAVPRKDPQVRILLNQALKRVRQSGRVDELVQRYFPLKVY